MQVVPIPDGPGGSPKKFSGHRGHRGHRGHHPHPKEQISIFGASHIEGIPNARRLWMIPPMRGCGVEGEHQVLFHWTGARSPRVGENLPCRGGTPTTLGTWHSRVKRIEDLVCRPIPIGHPTPRNKMGELQRTW